VLQDEGKVLVGILSGSDIVRWHASSEVSHLISL